MRIATAVFGMTLSIFGLLALVILPTMPHAPPWYAGVVYAVMVLVGVGLMIASAPKSR